MIRVAWCAVVMVAAACAAEGDGRPTRAPLQDSGVDASPRVEAGSEGAAPVPAPCEGEQDGSGMEVVVDGQRSPTELRLSRAGLAWINGSETFGLCNIRGCESLSDGQVISWPAGDPSPRAVATGLRPMSLAASATHLFFDLWGMPAGLATLPPNVGTVPWGGSAEAVVGSTEAIPVRLEADDDVFVLLAPRGDIYCSVARARPASFADPSSWARGALTGALRGFDTALDETSFYVAADAGLVEVNRDTLVPRWFFGPDIGAAPSGSVAVDATDVYYTLGETPMYGDDPVFDTIARSEKHGTARRILLTGEVGASDLEVDATHLYWLAHTDTCTRVRRAPKSGGPAETLFATRDLLTSIALDASWVYVTSTKPVTGSPRSSLRLRGRCSGWRSRAELNEIAAP